MPAHVMTENPAAAPLPSSSGSAAPAPPREGWAVPAGRGADWWGSAWRLFTAAPAIWIIITVVYVALMMVLSLIPILGQVAVSLLHPVFAG